jgi:eukaryotic-like serine/threonine-protein kinase
MGVVYEVEHVRTGQRLALKVLTQQPGASAERFKREARAATSIQSEHIVRVTDADVAPELGGAPFLVMELLEGADLARATGTEPASPADVIVWLRQVARALGKAHAAGIVHRDLKPENLFLTRREDGSALVKIVDFGIAKMAAEITVLTQSDSFLGTPGFMAPEQTDSKGPPVTFRADLYALGLIAFKLLTGHSYWRNGSLAQLLAQILVDPMSLPSDRGSTLGPAFDAWFLRACDRDPGKRFDSAVEQVEALALALGLPEQPRLSDSVPVATVAPESATIASAASLNGSASDVKAGQKRVSRRRWLAGALVSALMAIGIGSAFVRGGRHGEELPVSASAGDTGIPTAHANVSSTASPAPPADVASNAVGSPSSSAPSLPSPAPSGSVVKRKGAPSAIAAPGAPPRKGSPTLDPVWGER